MGPFFFFLEKENKLLQDRLETEQLRSNLDNERYQNHELTEKMEKILKSQENYKSLSEKRIKELTERIEQAKISTENQVKALEKEKHQLLLMKQNEKDSSVEAMKLLD